MKNFKTYLQFKKEKKSIIKKLIFLSKNCFNLSLYKTNLLYNIFVLRFSKLFVKNKYPRNRQWSKNIIYFGI